MLKTSSVDAAIIAERSLKEALTNPAPDGPFAQFGDAQQQAIIYLSKISESAIAKPALPITAPPQPAVRTVTPPSLQIPIPPSSPRVTSPPASPRVKTPPADPRLKIPLAYSPPSHPTVYLPDHLHVIDPECNGENINAVTVPRYRLQSHRQQRRFAAQELHYISANTSAMAHPPRFSHGTGSCYAQSTQHLIATEHRRTHNANTGIDTDTGQSL